MKMAAEKYFGRFLRPQIWISLAVLIALASGAISIGQQGSRQAIRPQTVSIQKKVPQTAQIDCLKVRCIALTFDDGPNPVTTPQILSVLEHEHVRGSFFIVGSRVPGNEQLIRRMYKDGDEIGNHSWTHPDMTKLTPAQIKQQVDLTQRVIASAGAPPPTQFRPPYGIVDAKVRANVPLTIMFWNEDPKDWAADKPNQVEAAVLGAARPGGVVDMHDIYHVTANALPKIIRQLKAQRYHFVTTSQLLDLKPGQKGEFFGRAYVPGE